MEYLTCAITGITAKRDVFGCNKHHFVKQQHWRKGKQWFIDNGIEQQEIPLWWELHKDIHSGMSDQRFLNKWEIDRHKLLFNRDKWHEGYYV